MQGGILPKTRKKTMKSIASNRIVLTLVLPILACGEVQDGAADEVDTGGADAGQAVPDTTAPTLLSTAPMDGDVGQLEDVEVVLTFSEAMDQESVEATTERPAGHPFC
jgi:hypothetical protein